MAPPKSGDEILIPIFDAENAGQPLTVKWSQNLSERTAQYYGLTVDNITTGACLIYHISLHHLLTTRDRRTSSHLYRC